MDRQTIIFLGPQGSGKGTQVQLFKKFLAERDSAREVVHFEMGSNLRTLATDDTFAGRATTASLARGELTPYAISSAVFAEYVMRHIISGDEHLVIEGFPRMLDQGLTLDSAMQFFKRTNLTVVYIKISNDEAVTRLLKRGRSDDTEEGIRTRLKWNDEQTAPVHQWFKERPEYAFLEVNGEQTVEQVQVDILKVLKL